MSHLSEREQRFSDLILPIRDLAINWDIDIATHLEEYLDELESIKFSVKGDKSNLNFAEAALLIQGSTAVYCRKVEYLHNLVLQALELVSQKNSQKVSY
jgi:condensin-2 complex subunit H2